MISYLCSLVQFSPATGRSGCCRQISLCGEHSPCSGHTGFALLTGVCAFPVYTAQAPGCSIWSEPCVECGSSFQVLHKSADSVAPAFCVFPGLSGSGSQGLGRPLPGGGPSPLRVFSLRGEQPRQPEAWAHFAQMRHTFSLCGPSTRRRSGLRKSLDRN